MAQNEDRPPSIAGEGLAVDCLECLQIYIDRGGGNDAEAD